MQAAADVAAQRAAVGSSEAESSASEAGLRAADETITTALATLERMKADAERARIDFERTEKLWNEKLIARQEYDTRRSALGFRRRRCQGGRGSDRTGKGAPYTDRRTIKCPTATGKPGPG